MAFLPEAPRIIEEVLFTHPKVAQAAVFGVPDDYYGEEVMAWIQLRAGQQAAAQRESLRSVLQRQGNLPGKPIVAQGKQGDWHEPAGLGVDARGHDPQREIGLRRGNAQTIGIVWAAVVLGIFQLEIVNAVGRQRGRRRDRVVLGGDLLEGLERKRATLFLGAL